MVSWSRKDEERLFTFIGVNGDSRNWHEASKSLSGRFTATECRLKFTEREQKRWDKEDDRQLWKMKGLVDLRLNEVSVKLRRLQHCIRERFIALTDAQKNISFCMVIEEDEGKKAQEKVSKTVKQKNPLDTKDDDQSPEGNSKNPLDTKDDDQSPEVNLQDGLYLASRFGDIELLEELLCRGVDINAKDKDGLTALHHAAWKGKLEIVKLLLTYGAKMNISDKVGRTPLQMSLKFGYSEVSKLLIKRGA